MEKHQAAQRVADQLIATEHALDIALAEASRLVLTLAENRRAMGLAIEVGSSATADLAGIVNGLAGHRQVVAQSHREFSTIARRFGFSPVAVGGGDKPPQPDSLPAARLAVVDASVAAA